MDFVMHDFVNCRCGSFIQKKDIFRLSEDSDNPKLWIATTNHGKYYISKTSLSIQESKKVTK